VQKDRRLDCHPACFCSQMDSVAMMASAEMGGEARNSTDLTVPASEVLVVLEGSPGNPQVTQEEMGSWGRLHVSVEVEHASEPDP